jgi:hypothetical protein
VALPALVIPDVHQNFERAEEIVAAHGAACASVVFLGDYLDCYEKPGEESMRTTVAWLRSSMRDPRRFHLLGNHDLAYLFCSPDTYCSGWDERRQAVFDEEVGADLDWMREHLPLAVQAGLWVLSHAGFGPRCRDASVAQLLEWAGHAHRALPRQGGRNPVHPLNGCGRVRGGDQSEGGLAWLDWRYEFQPLPGVHQMVGHTSDSAARYRKLNREGGIVAGALASWNLPRVMSASGYRSINWCLDAGLRAWAVIHPDHMAVDYDGHVVYCESPELGVGARQFAELDAFGLTVEAGREPPLHVSVTEISRLLGVEDFRASIGALPPGPSVSAMEAYLDAHTPPLVREFQRRLGNESKLHAGPAPHEVDKVLRALRRRGLLKPQL